mgnify:CR=1 FL=1
MHKHSKKVIVFKTDKKNLTYREMIQKALKEFEGLIEWNVDLEDSDKILRIECTALSPEDIIQKMEKAAFFCEELKD